MTIRFIEGDSYKVLKTLHEEGVRVASCVTDGPYGLTSITKRFGKPDAKAAKFGQDGAFGRYSEGFHGQTWDATGVERDPEFWRLVFDVILPGGYIVAFSSARTYHHMAVAIEAAGFVTHPMIGWAYASGLPKGHHPKVPGFEGYRHGGQARKPALEPIYVGQKPYSEKTCRLNLLKHGVGPVDIEGCRAASGNYPANLITDGSLGVSRLLRSDEGSAIGFFEEYSYRCPQCRDAGWIVEGEYTEAIQVACPDCAGESAASPFDGEPLIYHRKANAEDRAGSKHATVKPIGLMRSLVRHVTPVGHTTLDPFAGSGTTGAAADLEGRDAILIEAEPRYAMDIRRRMYELTDVGAAYFSALGVDDETDVQL